MDNILKVTFFNVNSIGQDIKRKAIFIKMSKVNTIILLQETLEILR